jgi:hypothetical protein
MTRHTAEPGTDSSAAFTWRCQVAGLPASAWMLEASRSQVPLFTRRSTMLADATGEKRLAA